MINHTASLVVLAACLTTSALADGSHAIHQHGAIHSGENTEAPKDFDILAAHVHREGDVVVFHMTTAGEAGATLPQATGQMARSNVLAYVWPTTLKPEDVGFESDGGIVAMVATSHPDFDDTPLFDENGDGNALNDGGRWHSHWVILAPNEKCGPGTLSVKDIPEGSAPKMPATWPGVPVYLDSPGFSPLLSGPEIRVNAVLSGKEGSEPFQYDGVTSALRVNANVHAPLLCVTDVFDVASGDLSLPGEVD